MSALQPDLIADAKARLGEGAIWHARQRVLYWVDILGKKFWRYNPATGHHEDFEVGQFVGTIVPRRHGGVLLGLHHGLAAFYPEALKLTMICDPEDNKPELRFNDGKCDPAGRFWAGTMTVDGVAPIGSLYCLYPDLHVERKVTEVGCSNGIVWSLDHKTMYYIDTVLQRVDAFDFDLATGHISNRRVAITVPKEFGYPDGSTLDADGMLWIAHWGGACVTRWNPVTGAHLATVKFPTTQITSCAFGGPQLDQLYVTSARVGRDTDPLAGALFCVDVGVKGIPAYEFAS
ncbi:MAG: SMP-30/gluconolactonase/LRE family protein [Verrucomicrobiota bacterium]